MVDKHRQREVYRRQYSQQNVQEVRKELTIVAEVVAEANTARIYIHMVPVTVQLRVHTPAAVVAVEDDNRTQVAAPVEHRIAVVQEHRIMGMVMAEVSNIILRKMSRTSQFQRRNNIYQK